MLIRGRADRDAYASQSDEPSLLLEDQAQLDQPEAVLADINLAPLRAGDFVIELTVGSGAATEKKLLAIRVVQ